MNIVVTSRSGPVDATFRKDIEAVDQALRQKFAGFAADAIEPEIRQSLDQLDTTLPADVINAYARSIGAREDFELVVD